MPRNGIRLYKLPQLWHSALSNATALAFDKQDCHFDFCRGNLACRMPRAWHSTEQSATPWRFRKTIATKIRIALSLFGRSRLVLAIHKHGGSLFWQARVAATWAKRERFQRRVFNSGLNEAREAMTCRSPWHTHTRLTLRRLRRLQVHAWSVQLAARSS
jgi:hypothetical protein